MSIYLKRYFKFIRHYRENPPSQDIYTERHHIRPRAFGGSNAASNMVRLPAKAHYLAHWMLSKAFPTHIRYRRKMQHAFVCMSMDRHGKRNTTAVMYERASILKSKIFKGIKTNRVPPNKSKPEDLIRECVVCSNQFSVIKPCKKNITCGKSCAARYTNLRRPKVFYQNNGIKISLAKKKEVREIIVCSKCGHKQKRSANFFRYHEKNCVV